MISLSSSEYTTWDSSYAIQWWKGRSVQHIQSCATLLSLASYHIQDTQHSTCQPDHCPLCKLSLTYLLYVLSFWHVLWLGIHWLFGGFVVLPCLHCGNETRVWCESFTLLDVQVAILWFMVGFICYSFRKITRANIALSKCRFFCQVLTFWNLGSFLIRKLAKDVAMTSHIECWSMCISRYILDWSSYISAYKLSILDWNGDNCTFLDIKFYGAWSAALW